MPVTTDLDIPNGDLSLEAMLRMPDAGTSTVAVICHPHPQRGGDMDNNVHPAGTIRLVHALIKANKRFDFIFGTVQPGSDQLYVSGVEGTAGAFTQDFCDANPPGPGSRTYTCPGGATPTPTPTATPTITPSATPTSTPTVTPSVTPSVTPTATPRATPRPRPTPHPRPTPP